MTPKLDSALDPSVEATSPIKSMLGPKVNPWFIRILILVSLAGSFLVWYGTFWGPWAFSDGVGYIVNARNFASGRGLGLYRASGQFVPLIWHSPLYPWMLAGLNKAGMDLVAAARWIDIVLFGAFLFVSGWGFWRLTRSSWLALGLSSVLLLHPALLITFLSAMSEPLFLFCIVSSLFLLADYLVANRRSRLLLAAVTAAAALLTRYTGAAWIVAGGLGLMFFQGTKWRSKVHDSLVFLGISVSPALAFVLWSRLVLGSVTPRALKAHFNWVHLVRSFTTSLVNSVQTWKPVPPDVIPDQILPPGLTHNLAAVLAIVLGAAILVAVITAIRRRTKQSKAERVRLNWQLSGLSSLFIISYLGSFAFAYILVSPTPDIDSRTLIPLLPFGLILLFSLADLIQRSGTGSHLFNVSLAAAILLSLGGWTIISQDTVLGMHRTGLGYTSRAWQSSETVRAVAALPPDLTLVSNETSALLLYTDRSAYELPGLMAGDPNPLSVPFGSGTSDLDQAYRDGHAALVLFDTVKGQLKSGDNAAQSLSPKDLTLGLHEIFAGNDGGIYCECSVKDIPAP